MKTADTIRVDQIADSVGKEIELNPQNKRIRAYHYKNEKQEIYYFVNEDETVYSGEIRVPHLGSCYAYDAWNGIKMVQEYRTDDESTTILSMKLRSGESRIVVVAQEKELETQLEKSLFEMMYGVEKEKIPVKKNWEIGTCRSIDYPKFSNFQPITKFEDNGTSQGIQILPPFLYDITEAVQDGENDIRIEVATTLERERGANKGKQAPIGIYSTVKIYQI